VVKMDTPTEEEIPRGLSTTILMGDSLRLR
jgi:hypothetical protein